MISISSILLSLAAAQTPDLEVSSSIDRVTVYNGQALVERVFEVQAPQPGAYAVVVGPLPMTTDSGSVQARLDQGPLVIQGLEMRERSGELDGTQRDVLSRQLGVLQQRLRDLGAEEEAIDAGEALVQSVLAAVRKGGVEALGRDGLSGMLPFLSGQVEQIDQRRIRWESDREKVLSEINNLRRQLGGDSAQARPYLEARVELFFERPGPAQLRLTYLTYGAGWEPVYDVRLDTELKQVQVGLVGRVHQATEEDWEGVLVQLSTSQPNVGLDPPELPRRWAGVIEPVPRSRNFGSALAPSAGAELRSAGYMDDGLIARDAVELAAEESEPSMKALKAPVVSVQDYGLSQQFQLPERVTLVSNQDPKSFRLINVPLEVRPERYVVPSLSERCFLRAEVTSASDAPLLPGTAMIFLGPDYLGEASFPILRPGDSTMLNLGLDPNLSLEWEMVRDERDDPGFLSSIVTQNRVYELKMKLSRSARDTIEVLVEEALPVSQDDRIRIKPLQMYEGALKSEADLKDREEKGVWRWRLPMAPGAEIEMRMGFTMTFKESLRPVMDEGR